jgi:hypothetical protein
MRSFQDVADASGITRNFRIGNLSCCAVALLYNDWQKTVAPEWRSGTIVGMQVQGRGSGLLLTLEGGATMTVKLHRERGRQR